MSIKVDKKFIYFEMMEKLKQNRYPCKYCSQSYYMWNIYVTQTIALFKFVSKLTWILFLFSREYVEKLRVHISWKSCLNFHSVWVSKLSKWITPHWYFVLVRIWTRTSAINIDKRIPRNVKPIYCQIYLETGGLQRKMIFSIRGHNTYIMTNLYLIETWH